MGYLLQRTRTLHSDRSDSWLGNLQPRRSPGDSPSCDLRGTGVVCRNGGAAAQLALMGNPARQKQLVEISYQPSSCMSGLLEQVLEELLPSVHLRHRPLPVDAINTRLVTQPGRQVAVPTISSVEIYGRFSDRLICPMSCTDSCQPYALPVVIARCRVARIRPPCQRDGEGLSGSQPSRGC